MAARLALFLLGLLLGAAAGRPPQRIVSTAPSITEILFAIGAGPRVVGVTRYCHFPPQVRKLPKIGSYLQPNIEAILALKPDLVVAPKTPLHSRSRFDAVGLPTVEVSYDSLADVLASIDRLGKATGLEENARRLAQQIRRELESIGRLAAGRPRPSLLFVVGRTPGALEGLVAVGRASYLNEIIALAGGRNAFEDAHAAYPKISAEEVLARDPDVIVDMGDMSDTDHVTEQQKQAVVALWNRFPQLKAVRNRRVYAVASDIYVVPGPRVVQLAREFQRMLHPDLTR